MRPPAGAISARRGARAIHAVAAASPRGHARSMRSPTSAALPARLAAPPSASSAFATTSVGSRARRAVAAARCGAAARGATSAWATDATARMRRSPQAAIVQCSKGGFMATPKSLRLFFAHHTVEQYRASSLLAPAGPESSSDRQIKLNAHGVRISRDLQVVRTRRFVVSAATNFLCVFWRFRARGEAGAATYLARRWRLSLRRVYARAS